MIIQVLISFVILSILIINYPNYYFHLKMFNFLLVILYFYPSLCNFKVI
jgi:hypothetical protein